MSYAQGGIKISDTALHSDLDVDTIEILEDSTAFDTANMETKQHPSGAWAAAVEMVSAGGEPTFDAASYDKGELIRMKSMEQRVIAIQLSAGSIRAYNSGTL